MSRNLYILSSLALAACLPACQSLKAAGPYPGTSPDARIPPPSSSVPPEAREGTPVADSPQRPPAAPATSQISYGTGRFFTSADSSPSLPGTRRGNGADSGQGFSFRNAPIEVVLNQVLGEAFGLNYTIDPLVTGTLTLRIDDIRGASEAVSALNAALALQGLEIVETNGGLVVSRKGQVKGTLGAPVFLQEGDSLPPGASLAVLQLRYAHVGDAVALARTMLPGELIRHSDDKLGIVVLSGSPDELSSGVALLKSLDVNWLASVSTALIPVEHVQPDELTSDLEPVLSRLGGVSVVPVPRLGKLLIIARNAQKLDEARAWISRFDQDSKPQMSRDVLVYEARYVNAQELAALTDGRSQPDLSYPTSSAFSQESGSGGSAGPALRTYPSGAREVRTSAASLYENLSVRVDPGRNAIVARGAADELHSLKELLTLLDKPKRQVLIEATIIEVSLSDGLSFGVQWDLVRDQLSATYSDVSGGAVSSLFPGVSLSYVNTDIAAVVNALATSSDVEIVSSPRLLVLNNETARLQIGDQVPIITQSAVSVTDPGAPLVNSTSYRDTGVILTVTPRIRAGGMVEIDVSQEVSGVSETTTSTIDSPTISQRSIQSVLSVPDGSTAILGGLMSSSRTISETGVPVLKDVPVFGAAFRSTSQGARRTELVVLIEPTVISGDEPAPDMPGRLRSALLRAKGDGLGN